MGDFLYGAVTRVLPVLNGISPRRTGRGVWKKARRHDIDDLMLKVAYTHLKAYEARRARQAAS
jgi:hypothetical protein